MKRHALSDQQWTRIEKLFPEEKPRRGRPWKNHRTMLDAMLYLLKTGIAWRDLPERFGPWQSVYDRFNRWRADGTFDRIVAHLQRDREGLIERERLLRRCDLGEGLPCSSGSPKKRDPNEGEPSDHALGRSRGGFTTKIHLLCDRAGIPLAALVSAGHRHESKYFEQLMDQVRIHQPVGAPRRRPRCLIADSAFAARRIRLWLRRRGIRGTIPQPKQRAGTGPRRGGPVRFDKEQYRERNVIERVIGWLKEYRRLATRYEKKALHYLAMIKLAFVERYLRIDLPDRA